MKHLLLSLLFMCFSIILAAQIVPGNYAGTMYLSPTTMGQDSMHVQLNIVCINDTLFQFKMTYDSNSVKDYQIIQKEASIVLDEKNGILLPGSLENNELHFHYRVNNRHFQVLYRFNADGSLDLDLHFYSPGEKINRGDFEIQGYPNEGRQRAHLLKTP